MSNSPSEVNVALLGLGVVGTGVARVLIQDTIHMQSVNGTVFNLKHILVNDINKNREPFIPQEILTTSLGIDESRWSSKSNRIIEFNGITTPNSSSQYISTIHVEAVSYTHLTLPTKRIV